MADNSPVAAETAVAELRRATADQHAQLEGRVDLARAFASADGYRSLLGMFLGIHRPLEPRLHAAAAVHLPSLELAPRVAHLEADLRVLGADPSALPDHATLLDLSSPEAVAGVVYVIEGSALGGAVLARMARDELGIDAASGGAFFGAERGLAGRWRATTAVIDATGRRAGPDAIVASAIATFAWIDDWMSR